MNREEFTRGYDRLTRGHRVDATAERAEATYRAISHVPASAWEEAVDVLLVEARMPDRTRLLAAVDTAHDRLRRASKPTPYLPDRIPEGAPDQDYGQARLDLIHAMNRGRAGYSKREIPDRLFELADRFPAHADALVREATELDRRLHVLGDSASEAPPPLNESGPARVNMPAPPEKLVLEPLAQTGGELPSLAPAAPPLAREWPPTAAEAATATPSEDPGLLPEPHDPESPSGVLKLQPEADVPGHADLGAASDEPGTRDPKADQLF